MAGINKAILIGNLGRDPELKYSQSGKAYCRLNLATTEKWGGEEKTEWHTVVLFDKLAEIAGEYLGKGRQVYIEGRIQTRKWQDQSGQDRYSTEIIAQNMTMLGGRREGEGDYAPAPRRESPKPAPARSGGGRPASMDDDPFSGDFGAPPTEDEMPF